MEGAEFGVQDLGRGVEDPGFGVQARALGFILGLCRSLSAHSLLLTFLIHGMSQRPRLLVWAQQDFEV